jgi:caffeoyl-CoA O-methyltransferase
MVAPMKFVPEPIEAYCLSHTTIPSSICEEIEAFTRSSVPYPQMLSGPLVGGFLGLMVGVTGARKIVEFGTYTGYSALAMAERLPDGGELYTLDKNPDTQSVARKFWDKSPHGKKIRPLNGNAIDLIAGIPGPIDLAFIDADKGGYLSYLKAVLPKLSPRGLVIADNTLWSGRVLEGAEADADTQAIQRFNDFIASSKDLEGTLLPVRDGLYVVRRRA